MIPKIQFDPVLTVRQAWEVFKANAGVHIAVFFLMFILQAVFSALSEKNATFLLLYVIVSMLVTLFLTGYAIRSVRKDVISINEVFSHSVSVGKIIQLFLFYLVAIILIIGLFLVVSFLFLGRIAFWEIATTVEMPGGFVMFLLTLFVLLIYLSLRLMFTVYFIVDQNQNFITAMESSWKVTKGEFLRLFFLWILMFFMGIAGFLLFVIGLLVAIPVIYFAQAVAYEILRQKLAPEMQE